MFDKKIKTTVLIEGMSCKHCASKVENALKSIDGVKSVRVDLDKKTALITSTIQLDKKQIEKEITDLSYQVIEIR